MNEIHFIHGINNKPVASEALEHALQAISNIHGECFLGYLLPTPEGKYSVDAVLISPEKGIILFDLVEGTDLGDYISRQDDLANKFESKLKAHKELVQGRRLIPPLYVVTFMPIPNLRNIHQEDNYPIANSENLAKIIAGYHWRAGSEELYRKTLSAIENLSSLRKKSQQRQINRLDSRGAKLKQLEDSIATLDHQQHRAVIETIDGVQRIRGLAGSGKTIILALKAAYLHSQHPDWYIAVTFQTRALKGQFKRLINQFCISQTNEEPDWTKVRIVNAWGAKGDKERDGIYYEFCRLTGSEFLDFSTAKSRFDSSEKAFDSACQLALDTATEVPEIYDAILVDEAQDLPPSFLRLCYSLLKSPKRLVYAYDELQNLAGTTLPSPEELFGKDAQGRPFVSLGNDRRRDIILEKCYRNSRPVLVTAHALGFGIYRDPPPTLETGLVQMFDQPSLWQEIGYRVCQGTLAKGEHVVLERNDETSPRFLESHSALEDLVIFHQFTDRSAQNSWIIEQIKKNLNEDELQPDDIVVIHPDPATARAQLSAIRKALFEEGIQTHLAGVDTDPDVFFKTDTPSITFTSIFRAKGNEAGMIYVVNAQSCNATSVGLASLRNRLFTAITRSKAWVRVTGYGAEMENLVKEFKKLQQNNFRLEFIYPTDDILKKLRIVHRDYFQEVRQRLADVQNNARKLTDALESGEVTVSDLDPETRDKLVRFLGSLK